MLEEIKKWKIDINIDDFLIKHKLWMTARIKGAKAENLIKFKKNIFWQKIQNSSNEEKAIN